jgi:Zn-dependent protease with chaperone function
VRAIFGRRTCEGAEGQAAFTALVERLRAAGNFELPLDAHVLAHELPNAFALPGGKVYVMSALLQRARNPDELAGVLAHELGHVYHRDGLRRLIQAGGSSFLIGLLLGDVFGGGAVVLASRSILEASYSREAEERADAFAAAVMHKLGRSPRPLGEFLLRLTGSRRGTSSDGSSDRPSRKDAVAEPPKKDGSGRPRPKGFTIFDSHPLSEDRLAAMAKLDRPSTGPELLSAEQWKALKAICGNKE